MIGSIILALSLVALGQFGLYYWRAMLSGVAAQAISDRIRSAAGITAAAIGAQDFYKILIVNDLSPDLRGPGGSFRVIRTYYTIVEKLGSIFVLGRRGLLQKDSFQRAAAAFLGSSRSR